MKFQLFLKPLAFVVILFILLSSLNFLLKYGVKNSADSQTGKVNKIILHKIDPVLMIFGSSVAETGFNTPVLSQELELSSFNAALDGTSYQQYKVLVTELNDYSKNTNLIIFGITYFDFVKSTQLSEPNRFYAHINNKHVYNAFYNIDPKKMLKMHYIPFYSFTQYNHTFYKNAYLGLSNHFTKKTIIDSLQGFVPHDTEWYSDTTLTNETFTLNLSQVLLTDFKRLKEELKSNGRKVIIVFMPMHISGQKQISNLKEIVQEVSKLADPGLFYNYLESSISYNKKFFYNNNHLNRRGAKVFSKSIVKNLKREI